MDDGTWGTVGQLVDWLDRASAQPPETERLLRIMKLSEEVGEVTQAVFGAIGQNPRKGFTHSWHDVQSELCDVILTAMVALATITPDAREMFAEQLALVAARSLPQP
jgi:NTP pyrophosphatase (non-canonical NTP hydrolase)